MDTDAEPVVDVGGTSGDPLLKRLVDLAHLGFAGQLTLLSNGAILTGTLIAPSTYRAALAQSIHQGDEADAFAILESIIAAAIDADDPGPSGLGAPGADIPEPRFIHLADVRMGTDKTVIAPFMRLRLPAVSGFWLTTAGGDEGEAR